MESEGDEIKSKQASKKDRTLLEILPEDGFRLLVAGECPVGDRFLVLEASAVEAEVNFRAFLLIR